MWKYNKLARIHHTSDIIQLALPQNTHVELGRAHTDHGIMAITIFTHNLKTTRIKFCSYPDITELIVSKILHMTRQLCCAKFWCDLITTKGVTETWCFNGILISSEKLVIKRDPGPGRIESLPESAWWLESYAKMVCAVYECMHARLYT